MVGSRPATQIAMDGFTASSLRKIRERAEVRLAARHPESQSSTNRFCIRFRYSAKVHCPRPTRYSICSLQAYWFIYHLNRRRFATMLAGLRC